MDLEGGGHDQFEDTTLAFTWRNWWKPQKLSQDSW